MRKIVATLVGPLVAAFTLLAPYVALAAQIGVLIGDNYYGTKSISISTGDTVTWHNYGTASHTITSDNGYFDSQSIPPGQKFEYTFTVPGTYRYYDKYFGGANGTGMSGTVVVNGAAVTNTPATNPSTSGTQTAAQLQAQTEALLLLAQAKKQQPVQSATQPACPTLKRNLYYGLTGSDVSELQKYLAADVSVYPEGLTSGFYGSLTQAAVQRWQAKNGVVTSGAPDTTGYGVVGPKTRTAIAAACASDLPTKEEENVGGFFKVTPVAGKTPMYVTVDLTINTSGSCSSSTYTLDYGDGSVPLTFNSSASSCQPQSIKLTHVYQWGGSYPITLTAGTHKTSTSVVAVGLPNPNTPSVGSTTIGTTGTGAVGTIKISDSSFAPTVFTIPPGTQVVWTNDGLLRHTVTADNGSFDSGIIEPAKTFSSVFTQEGTFPYYCKFHGAAGGIGMSGIIVVSKTAKAPASPANSATATTQKPSASSGTYSVVTNDVSGKESKYTKPELTFGAGHTVTMTFNTGNTCDPYTLDWGDGTNTKLKSQGFTGCSKEGLQTETHKFPNAGAYTIVLSRGVGSLHTDTITAIINN